MRPAFGTVVANVEACFQQQDVIPPGSLLQEPWVEGTIMKKAFLLISTTHLWDLPLLIILCELFCTVSLLNPGAKPDYSLIYDSKSLKYTW